MKEEIALAPEQFHVRVAAQHVVAEEHFELIMEPHPVFERTAPGQFINVAVSGADQWDPLLRRPFSLYRRFPDGAHSILYRAVGRGTRILSRLTQGDTLDIIAPLGKGFSLLPGTSRPALVGGGVGVPPLFIWAQKVLVQRGEVRAVLGFNHAGLVICDEDMAELGIQVDVTTLDGSQGQRGLVTDALEPRLEAGEIDAIYACGPYPMLAAVASMAERFGIPAQLALEEWMGCGVGACLSCVVPIRTGDDDGSTEYQRVCVEGPVFPAEEVYFA